MNKILILFAHPRFEMSKTNRVLLNKIEELPGVTLNDLYERYPDYNIDVAWEKKLRPIMMSLSGTIPFICTAHRRCSSSGRIRCWNSAGPTAHKGKPCRTNLFLIPSPPVEQGRLIRRMAATVLQSASFSFPGNKPPISVI